MPTPVVIIGSRMIESNPKRQCGSHQQDSRCKDTNVWKQRSKYHVCKRYLSYCQRAAKQCNVKIGTFFINQHVIPGSALFNSQFSPTTYRCKIGITTGPPQKMRDPTKQHVLKTCSNRLVKKARLKIEKTNKRHDSSGLWYGKLDRFGLSRIQERFRFFRRLYIYRTLWKH